MIPQKERGFLEAREYALFQRDKIQKEKEGIFKHGFTEEVGIPESIKRQMKELFEIHVIKSLASEAVNSEERVVETLGKKITDIIESSMSGLHVIDLLKEPHPSGSLEAHLQELPVTKASPLISSDKTYMPEPPEPVCLFICKHKERIEAMNLDLREVAVKIIAETDSPFILQVVTFLPPIPAFVISSIAKWQETALEREKKRFTVFPERAFRNYSGMFPLNDTSHSNKLTTV